MAEAAIDLAARREAANAKLAGLRAGAGAAVLDGGKAANWQDLAAAEAELTAVDAAEAERTRREREAEAAPIAALRQTLKAELKEAEQRKLVAVGRAETAARDFVAAMGDVLADAAAVRGVCARLGVPPPDGADGPELMTRLGQHLGATQSGIAGRAPAPVWLCRVTFHRAALGIGRWSDGESLLSQLETII
jgi:hypothetical protein